MRFKSKSKANDLDLFNDLQLKRKSLLGRAMKRTLIALRLKPKEEFILTRYHPHLIQPYTNASNFSSAFSSAL